jgi:hypothetical protein
VVLFAGPGAQVAAKYEIPICATGTWVKNSYRFSITSKDLAAMAAELREA